MQGVSYAAHSGQSAVVIAMDAQAVRRQFQPMAIDAVNSALGGERNGLVDDALWFMVYRAWLFSGHQLPLVIVGAVGKGFHQEGDAVRPAAGAGDNGP